MYSTPCRGTYREREKSAETCISALGSTYIDCLLRLGYHNHHKPKLTLSRVSTLLKSIMESKYAPIYLLKVGKISLLQNLKIFKSECFCALLGHEWLGAELTGSVVCQSGREIH